MCKKILTSSKYFYKQKKDYFQIYISQLEDKKSLRYIKHFNTRIWYFKGFLKFENCVDPSFRSSSSKQKAKGVNLVSVFLRHNFLLPSNFLTLPFLIVTLQSLIKFWLFGHWPRKFTRWLIGSTKKSNINLYILSNCIASSLIYES